VRGRWFVERFRAARRLLVTVCGVQLALGAGAQAPPVRLFAPEAVLDGSEAMPVRWPVAVAAESDTAVAIADAARPRLVLFERTGASWHPVREVELDAAPTAVAWNGRRYLVAVRGRGELVAIDPRAPGSERTSLPTGVVPGALAVLPGADALVLWDAAQGRLLRLAGSKIAFEIAVEPAVTALASDLAGGVWAAIGAAGEVRRYDADGRLVTTWRVPPEGSTPAWPAGLAAEPGGRLLVVDRAAARRRLRLPAHRRHR